jgi:hemolysin D
MMATAAKSIVPSWRLCQRMLTATREIVSSGRLRQRMLTAAKEIVSSWRLRRRRSDQEFLPAAEAILETPPSPVRVSLMWTICLLFAFATSWSYFGHIDILATASGKIQPIGRVKVIQPVETGKVVAINVRNGQRVEAGNTLILLDTVEATADETATRTDWSATRAEALRRRVAIDRAKRRELSASEPIDWPADIPVEARNREELVLKGDLTQLENNAKSVDAQIAQKNAEAARFISTIAAQAALVSTLKERVTMRNELYGKRVGTKASLIDATETLQAQETGFADQKGQLAQTRAAINVLAEDHEKVFDTFIANNGQKLAEVERQIDGLWQKLAKMHSRTGHMTLTSPIAGTVMGLNVTTLGQLITAGEEVMRVVPGGAALEIECYAQNQDIGFIRAGQPAVVKVESFPFTRYGTIDAVVTHVADDAIPASDAQAAEGDPASAPKTSFLGGAQRVQNLVFPVTLALKQVTMNVDGRVVPLSPGMAVSVEVKTGRRRILEYVFSPLVETSSKAMRER